LPNRFQLVVAALDAIVRFGDLVPGLALVPRVGQAPAAAVLPWLLEVAVSPRSQKMLLKGAVAELYGKADRGSKPLLLGANLN